MSVRSPEEIRASIEANRQALAVSVERLRGEVAVITDWRRHLRENQRNALAGAAVVGFVAAGGLTALFRRRR